MIVIFNKPYGILSKFTDDQARPTLAAYLPHRGIYPAGRLDADSEGLLVLTDDGALQARISHPKHHRRKTYWAQVEGQPDRESMARLIRGPLLKDGPTHPLSVRLIEEPACLWPRDPPIRFRKSIPTAWLEIVIAEGRNRQVRRMTAAVGHPTLRLIRSRVGPWSIEGMQPGEWREVSPTGARQ